LKDLKKKKASLEVLKALSILTQILEEGGISSARLEAEVFLSYLLKKSRAELYTLKRKLKEKELLALSDMVKRRLQGEPVAYIIGEKEFWSLRFKITPACLIPRPETELLVEEVLRLSSSSDGPLKILDIGTGCGAIAIALAKELPSARIWASERSREALKVAEENVALHQVGDRVFLVEADLFPEERDFSFIVSNPPYIPTQEIFNLPPEVRDYEPLEALDGGPDGFSVIRRIVEGAGRYLREGGWLLLEVGYGQAEKVEELFRKAGFKEVSSVRDYAGIKRVVKGRWEGLIR
jgi:release factor glutamine methyltransferase